MQRTKLFFSTIWLALWAAVLPLTAACLARTCCPGGIPAVPAYTDAAPDADAQRPDAEAGAPRGYAIYLTERGRIGRIALRAGAQPEDLSARLDALSAGKDRAPSAAPGGVLFATTRFGCGDGCLAFANGDVTAATLLDANHALIPAPDGNAAMSPDGSRIAFAARGPRHARDLFVVARTSPTAWGAARNVTEGSPYALHAQPSFSSDGNRLVFDCAKQEGDTSLCEAGADGGGFRVVMRSDDLPGERHSARHGAYETTNGFVFELTTDRDGTHVVRLAPGGTAPARIGEFANDLAPCVLPDGSIVTHWASAPVPHGDAIKVMAPDGATFDLLPLGEPIVRGSVTCAA